MAAASSEPEEKTIGKLVIYFKTRCSVKEVMIKYLRDFTRTRWRWSLNALVILKCSLNRKFFVIYLIWIICIKVISCKSSGSYGDLELLSFHSFFLSDHLSVPSFLVCLHLQITVQKIQNRGILYFLYDKSSYTFI